MHRSHNTLLGGVPGERRLLAGQLRLAQCLHEVEQLEVGPRQRRARGARVLAVAVVRHVGNRSAVARPAEHDQLDRVGQARREQRAGGQRVEEADVEPVDEDQRVAPPEHVLAQVVEEVAAADGGTVFWLLSTRRSE
jgi:ubiquinone biosynthesis protein UbiJ